MSFTDFKKIANSKGQMITFTHVPTGNEVSFPAFLTAFSDRYSVGWGNTQIYGRSDPIKPYQSTTRSLNIAFDILSNDIDDAKENLANYSTLVKMLYPVYSEPLNGAAQGGSLGRTIAAPPLIRMRFVNLVKAAGGNESLLGCIGGFDFNPNQQAGFFVDPSGDIFPKVFNISINFDPQHEQSLGWEDNTFITEEFPYGSDAFATPVAQSFISTGNSEISARQTNRVLNGGGS